MKIKLVDLREQYLTIQDEIDRAIQACLNESWFIGGEKVKSFEQNFASFCHAKYCASCGNGTDALEIALKTAGIKESDEVIVPAFTFVATAEAVTNAGAKVVFCDIDPVTFNMNVHSLADLVTPKTRAIIAVHLFGQMAEMDKLSELAKENNICLIEDASQAHGATYKGKPVGYYSSLATFSFFPGKNLGAYGDGGAIITNIEEYYTHAKKLSNHGRITKYDHDFEGRNSRLDTIQASILDVKLKYLNDWNKRRRTIAQYYNQKLNNIQEIELPGQDPHSGSVYHLYVIKTLSGNRNELAEYLLSKGIHAGIHYPKALPDLMAYSHLKIRTKEYPIARNCAEKVISIPVYPELTDDKLDYICRSVREYFGK